LLRSRPAHPFLFLALNTLFSFPILFDSPLCPSPLCLVARTGTSSICTVLARANEFISVPRSRPFPSDASRTYHQIFFAPTIFVFPCSNRARTFHPFGDREGLPVGACDFPSFTFFFTGGVSPCAWFFFFFHPGSACLSFA